MELKNPFSNETRNLFYEKRYQCFNCGANGWDRGGIECHHLLSRISSSPFNLAPLCGKCHQRVGHTRDEHRKLFNKTFFWLDAIKYKPTKEDWAFFEKNFDELVGEDIIKWMKNQ